MSKRRKWQHRPKGNGAQRTTVNQRRVSILIPAGDMCHTQFAISLANMIQHTILNVPDNLEGLLISSFGTSILPLSRQILAQSAVRSGMTHMLWIDSDMAFRPDMLLQFLKHDEPIVGINAASRRKPFKNTAQSAENVPLITRPDSTGLEKVHRCGFGVLWLSCDVIAKMEPPWFTFDWMPELGIFRGEDYSFLERAKALGYDVYVDHDISKEVNHIGQFEFNPQMASVIGEMGMSPEDMGLSDEMRQAMNQTPGG